MLNSRGFKIAKGEKRRKAASKGMCEKLRAYNKAVEYIRGALEEKKCQRNFVLRVLDALGHACNMHVRSQKKNVEK